MAMFAEGAQRIRDLDIRGMLGIKEKAPTLTPEILERAREIIRRLDDQTLMYSLTASLRRGHVGDPKLKEWDDFRSDGKVKRAVHAMSAHINTAVRAVAFENAKSRNSVTIWDVRRDLEYHQETFRIAGTKGMTQDAFNFIKHVFSY